MTPQNERASGDFSGLPGADIVDKGLRDLAAGTVTAEALAVVIFEPRLQTLGIAIPRQGRTPNGENLNLELYAMLEEQHGAEAHSRYNALLRRVISFASALERESSAGAAQASASQDEKRPLP